MKELIIVFIFIILSGILNFLPPLHWTKLILEGLVIIAILMWQSASYKIIK